MTPLKSHFRHRPEDPAPVVVKVPRGWVNSAAYYELLRKAKAGDLPARQEFEAKNMGLVYSIAKRYQHPAFSRDDFAQEGYLGLRKGVEKFDVKHGTKFSTYATWWIRQSIRRAMQTQGHEIRIPTHVTQNLRYLYGHINRFTNEKGRNPTFEEIEELAARHNVPHTALDALRTRRLRSLNKPVSLDEGTMTLGEITPKPGSPRDVVTELVDRDETREWTKPERDALDKALSTLDWRSELILRASYQQPYRKPTEPFHHWLNDRLRTRDEEPITLAETGRKINVGRERVRQLEKKALSELANRFNQRGRTLTRKTWRRPESPHRPRE